MISTKFQLRHSFIVADTPRPMISILKVLMREILLSKCLKFPIARNAVAITSAKRTYETPSLRIPLAIYGHFRTLPQQCDDALSLIIGQVAPDSVYADLSFSLYGKQGSST